MIPRCNVGSGVTGAVRYALSEGKDSVTGLYRTQPKGDQTRVAWMGGTGFGFEIESAADVDLARRIMEFVALNQSSRTRQCEKDCLHLSLGWRPGEEPTRAQMEEAALDALAALGMGNARAVFVAHSDERYAHLHIVASKINPETGRAYDLKGNYITLSKWAERYERDFSGGIVVTRREEANLLRDAIDRRDAPAVLELMTQQRATFKGRDLERVLGKQIKREFERVQFGEKVLALPDAVQLADAAGGRVTRYTTRTVLQAEGEVLLAAEGLHSVRRHQVAPGVLLAVLGQPEFIGISGEQLHAVRHAIGAEGLALVDGQAGTGKSFAVKAIRQAYEREGYRVIGLAPTNAVAGDMRESGFAHAATIHSEIFRLNNGRASWSGRTAVILDEAAMIDTKLMAEVMRRADQAGAKLVMVGDDRQLSSIDRGGMFGVLKDRYGAAELVQVRRQNKNDDRRAAELLAEGNFDTALGMYDKKGAIHWAGNQEGARAQLVAQWTKDSAAEPAKSRFVFAYTNSDVDELNRDLREVRRQRGELQGEDHRFTTRHGDGDFAVNDRLQITGTDKGRGLVNGAAGSIEKIEGDRIALRLDGRGDKRVEFDAREFQDFRHGYAGTIYKGQGRTLDQTYLYHSEHWRSAASYVALTRHRDKAELFVGRDNAENVKQLARQMARVDDRRAASAFYQPGIDQSRIGAGIATGAGAGTESDMNTMVPPEEATRHTRPVQGTGGIEQPVEVQAKENADRLVQQNEFMRDQHLDLVAFEAEKKREAEAARAEDEKKREDEKKQEAERQGNAAEGEIKDAGDRYRVALGNHYDVRDPYGSLAKAAMAEYGSFVRDRAELTQQIATEKDPVMRRTLELRREIEVNDYMAITSSRIAGQSEVISGRKNSDEAVEFRERAAIYGAESKDLRQQLREHVADRGQQQEPSNTNSRLNDTSDTQRTDSSVDETLNRASPQRASDGEGGKAGKESGEKGEVTDAKAPAKDRFDQMVQSANERAASDQAGRSDGGRGGGGMSGR